MRTFQINGAVVFWNCGPSSRDILAARLESLAQMPMPEDRTNRSALHNALEEYAKVRAASYQKVLVRPNTHPEKNGFSVVIETPGEECCKHSLSFTAKVDENSGVSVNDTLGHADAASIQALFYAQKAILTGESVGKALVKLLANLGAVCLRDAGGIYWLPEDKAHIWLKAAEAVEAASNGRRANQVQAVWVAKDDQTAKAVRDGLVQEITLAATSLAEEVTAGNLGEEAIKNRLRNAMALHGRIQSIEGILNESLTRLHAIVKSVEMLATQAALEATGV